VVMARRGVSRGAARTLLAAADGRLRDVIGPPAPRPRARRPG